MSVYICPVCGKPLEREGNVYKCAERHSFDIASSGYVNLSPPSSGSHGDDADMVTARRAFLEGGYYSPLCEAVCEAAAASSPATLLDAGCGEGYYTERIGKAVPGCAIYGVDISKKAAEKASKRCRGAHICVASVYRMPYADHSFDLVVNIFSPLSVDEYARVIRRGGRLLLAVPEPDHLIELKRAVYDTVNVKEMKGTELPGFTLENEKKISFLMDLDGQSLQALFMMTPYYHKTSYEDKAKLGSIERLSVTASFSLFSYIKS